jgi:hypothetical protein
MSSRPKRSCACCGIAAERGVAHVAAHQQAGLAFRFDVALGVLRILVLVQVDDGHVRAFARVQHGHGAADAGVAAGNQAAMPASLPLPQ